MKSECSWMNIHHDGWKIKCSWIKLVIIKIASLMNDKKIVKFFFLDIGFKEMFMI